MTPEDLAPTSSYPRGGKLNTNHRRDEATGIHEEEPPSTAEFAAGITMNQ